MTDDEIECTARMMHEHVEVFVAHCLALGIREDEARAALETPQVKSAATLLALQVMVLRKPAAGNA